MVHNRCSQRAFFLSYAQDNEPLMRALTKLISVNAPDLVLFVGEAHVGNEAIDQLVKFNAALADHSHQVKVFFFFSK